MASIPELTRLLAAIHTWRDGHGQPGGRAEAARRLDEAYKLLRRGGQRADRDAAGVAGRRQPGAVTRPESPSRAGTCAGFSRSAANLPARFCSQRC